MQTRDLFRLKRASAKVLFRRNLLHINKAVEDRLVLSLAYLLPRIFFISLTVAMNQDILQP